MKILHILMIVSLLLAGCLSNPNQSPATATVQAAEQTATPTLAPTEAPEATATPAPLPTPAPTLTPQNTATLTTTVATSGCTEQMLGPWQPPADKPYYDYIQVNTEFVDSDYLVSLYWEKGISLSDWQVQKGDGKNTEVVFTVRTSIKEVQFQNPRSGVAWRLCAHPNAQLGQEAKDHADRTAAARSWLGVYNVGDLWASLQTGDKELIALIKCVTPPTQGIPDCHTP